MAIDLDKLSSLHTHECSSDTSVFSEDSFMKHRKFFSPLNVVTVQSVLGRAVVRSSERRRRLKT